MSHALPVPFLAQLWCCEGKLLPALRSLHFAAVLHGAACTAIYGRPVDRLSTEYVKCSIRAAHSVRSALATPEDSPTGGSPGGPFMDQVIVDSLKAGLLSQAGEQQNSDSDDHPTSSTFTRTVSRFSTRRGSSRLVSRRQSDSASVRGSTLEASPPYQNKSLSHDPVQIKAADWAVCCICALQERLHSVTQQPEQVQGA